jgi:tetratricopeptide (TPR) repeat protein
MMRLWFLLTLAAIAALGALLVLGSQPRAHSLTELQTLRVANSLLERDQRQEAIEIYEQLIAQGVEHSDLFHNLAGAYRLEGDNGRALLYYLRAAQLAPRDEDIATHIAAVRAEVGRATSAGTLPAQVALRLETALTLNEMGAAALGFWIAFALLWMLVRRLSPGLRRRFSTLLLVAVTVFMLASGSLFAYRVYRHWAEPLAVVVTPRVAVSPAPGATPANPVMLQAGTEVRVRARQEHWLEVAVEGGRAQGWVPADSVGIVG